MIDLRSHFLQERLEHERQRQQQAESFQAEQKRLEEERRNREVQRRKQELQDIEKKQAMDKIAALKKTTVGAKALKDLTPEVIFVEAMFSLMLAMCQPDRDWLSFQYSF